MEPSGVKTVFIGADHRGYELKNQLARELRSRGYVVQDCGSAQYDVEDDFTEPARAVAAAVAADPAAFGILLCGSAHGVCMQANRFPKVRAVNVLTVDSAATARAHNDANVLCLAADWLTFEPARAILATFLATPALTDPKYRRRIERLDAPLSSPQTELSSPQVPLSSAQPVTAQPTPVTMQNATLTATPNLTTSRS